MAIRIGLPRLIAAALEKQRGRSARHMAKEVGVSVESWAGLQDVGRRSVGLGFAQRIIATYPELIVQLVEDISGREVERIVYRDGTGYFNPSREPHRPPSPVKRKEAQKVSA